ncbi:NlpC/P60 family protein [Kitasatospora sp. NPDC058406]|uniref:NlpC/P60 family protein n=1 Tax=Kitasatospora sp. NPDC058406 TaxID=3346483 RepID=UPI003665AFB8
MAQQQPQGSGAVAAPVQARYQVAGRSSGMAAGQVPVPGRSVPIGRPVVGGARPRAARAGARTLATGAATAAGTATAAGSQNVLPPVGRRATVAAGSVPRGMWRAAVAAVLLVLAALAVVAVDRVAGQAPPGLPAVASGTSESTPGPLRSGLAPGGPVPATATPVSPTGIGTPAAPTAPAPPVSAPTPAPAASEPPTGPAPTAPGTDARTRAVRIVRGETLWELARRHGTTVSRLQELNELGASTRILAGADLNVPAPPSASAPPSALTAPAGTRRSSDAPTDGSSASASAGTAPTGGITATGSGPGGDRTAAVGSGAQAAVAYARAALGKPYVWGASGPGAYDCSGLVMRAWQAGGVVVPRTTWGMATAGRATTRASLVPGDLVITNGGAHVQLYLGGGKVIHSPGRGRSVVVAPLTPPAGVTAYRHVG